VNPAYGCQTEINCMCEVAIVAHCCLFNIHPRHVVFLLNVFGGDIRRSGGIT